MTDVRTPPQAPTIDTYGPTGRSAWLDIDWREHQRWVQVAGAPVNVIDIGEGDPIVFVHGLSGAWVNWLENIPHFARDHRVIAMDLPGFGHSPMPAEKISVSGYGQIVDELLGALDVDRAVIVGNSMGGFIGAEVAIQFSTRVEKLVLVSAAGISIEHQRNEPVLRVLELLDDWLILGGGWAATRSEALSGRPRIRRQIMKLVAHRAEKLPAALIAEQVKGSGKPGFVPALDALTDYPIRDRLADIRCPVLVVWGEQDRLVPVRDAYEFGRLIPDARVVVWPETGHVAMLERPDAFNALVDEFIAQ
ncbi:MAG TPA: alpha/beta fold hydrolase [Thermoleophilaceae bacterium]|nr:alpha/beta fold hydrolase [Thermoleophilaceae bacterium]